MFVFKKKQTINKIIEYTRSGPSGVDKPNSFIGLFIVKVNGLIYQFASKCAPQSIHGSRVHLVYHMIIVAHNSSMEKNCPKHVKYFSQIL